MCLFMGASQSSSGPTSRCFSESPVVWGNLRIGIGTGPCNLGCGVECLPSHAWSPGFGAQHHITMYNTSIQHPPLRSELFTRVLRIRTQVLMLTALYPLSHLSSLPGFLALLSTSKQNCVHRLPVGNSDSFLDESLLWSWGGAGGQE